MNQSLNVPEWLSVSRETEARLWALCHLVSKWNPTVNLVSKSSVTDIWQRHLLDSAQLFSLAPDEARHWLDIGSGAGFPGIVIAILAAERRPELLVSLVESDRRKAVFLAQAVRTLNVSAVVFCQRVESIAPMNADVVSARALASLDGLCRYAKMHLDPDGMAIFPKGANAALEIDSARRNWHFLMQTIPSKTDSAASILLLKGITNA